MDESAIIRQAKNAYMREWRRKNPDKVKRNNERYWLRKAGQLGVTGDIKKRGVNG